MNSMENTGVSSIKNVSQLTNAVRIQASIVASQTPVLPKNAAPLDSKNVKNGKRTMAKRVVQNIAVPIQPTTIGVSYLENALLKMIAVLVDSLSAVLREENANLKKIAVETTGVKLLKPASLKLSAVNSPCSMRQLAPILSGSMSSRYVVHQVVTTLTVRLVQDAVMNGIQAIAAQIL